jgi:hypothetical protein
VHGAPIDASSLTDCDDSRAPRLICPIAVPRDGAVQTFAGFVAEAYVEQAALKNG